MEKDIYNVDIVIYRLRLASIKASNHKLEIVKEKKQNRDEIVE